MDGVLYVDDSISTTPEAAIVALDVYRDRAVTVIIGGYDRGLDYGSLVERLQMGTAAWRRTTRCWRPTDQCAAQGRKMVDTMREAVARAREMTPDGGVILLSPAAPSYGMYRSFIERGKDFARCAGL